MAIPRPACPTGYNPDRRPVGTSQADVTLRGPVPSSNCMNARMTRQLQPPAVDNAETFAEAWANHHSFILGIAYRLLGSYSDAEDVVQEAFSRLLRGDPHPIEDVRAWLVVVTSRLCLDQLRSARMRREAYPGQPFPEPLVGPVDASADPLDLVTLDESVRMTFLIALERMSPAERVVFVLHDVFEFPFERVATIVGRSAAACRQLASRARRAIKVEQGAARFPMDPEEQSRVIDAFIAACSSGEMSALLPLLDPAVIGWADVGRMLSSVSAPTVGVQAVAEGVLKFFWPGSGTTLEARSVNGEPGIVAFRNGSVFAVLALTVREGLVTRLYAQADPRKLVRVVASPDTAARRHWPVRAPGGGHPDATTGTQPCGSDRRGPHRDQGNCSCQIHTRRR